MPLVNTWIFRCSPMSETKAFIIVSVPSGSGRPAVYWSEIDSDLGQVGVWSFEITDAKRYPTTDEAWEFASSTDGLNLSDDQFIILPYIY